MKPVFYRRHHFTIAKMLGHLTEADELVQLLTNKFGEFFQQDNPTFDFKRFQSMVAREREGKD